MAACFTAILTAATSILLLALKGIYLFKRTPEQVQARAYVSVYTYMASSITFIPT